MTAAANDRPSRLETVIVLLLSGVPLIAAVLYGAVDSWTLGLLAILMAVVALLWLAEAWRSGKFRYSRNSLQVPIFGLIAIGLVQLLPLGGDRSAGLLAADAVRSLSMDPYATRLFLMRAVILLVFFAAALTFINDLGRARKIAVAIIIFGAGVAFFGILQRLATPEAIYGLRPTPQAIPFGPYVNQHHFGALMEMTSGLALGLVFGHGFSRGSKFLVGIAAGIMGMAIIFTGSRGALLSYFAVIVFVVVASFVRAQVRESDTYLRRNLIVAAAAVGLVAVVLASVIFLGGEASLLRGIGMQENPTDPTSGRMHFWEIAGRIFLDNPIIGAGLDAYGVAFTRYDTWSGLFRVEQAHNDYLQMLADGGLLGFACVVAFVVLLARVSIGTMASRSHDAGRSMAVGALAGCFGILVHSFVDFPLRTPANAFFFLLLVALAARKG